jgi:hypothetical protein
MPSVVGQLGRVQGRRLRRTASSVKSRGSSPALDRDHAHRALHRRRRHRPRTPPARTTEQPRRRASGSTLRRRTGGIEPHLAAEKVVGQQPTEHEVRVGHGRRAAAP